MANFFKKKKLIDDSSDVYISDYDKNLDYSYLSDIIEQKRAYKQAESIGDAAGMKNANDRANSIRLQAGSYTAGTDGSKYNRVKRPYEADKPSKEKSEYETERDRVYDKIAAYGDFDYDIDTDPLYKTYRDIYTSLGDDAYERALAENSLRTGGVSSTSAISAAQSAKNKYNSMLADIVPELYDKAYEKYRGGLEKLYKMLDIASDIEKDDYSRYRDEVSDYEADRDYYYKKDADIADEIYDKYKDETSLSYDISRDEAEDEQNAVENAFNEKKLSVESALEAQKLSTDAALREKEIENYSEKTKYQTAVNLAKALYGKVPVSRSVIENIFSLLD